MGFGRFKSLLVIAFGAFLLLPSIPLFSQPENGKKDHEKHEANHEKKGLMHLKSFLATF